MFCNLTEPFYFTNMCLVKFLLQKYNLFITSFHGLRNTNLELLIGLKHAFCCLFVFSIKTIFGPEIRIRVGNSKLMKL